MYQLINNIFEWSIFGDCENISGSRKFKVVVYFLHCETSVEHFKIFNVDPNISKKGLMIQNIFYYFIIYVRI